MRRRSSLLALLALALAACGGGDDEPAASESSTSTETTAEVDDAAAPEDYANSVCGAIAGWYDEIDAASTSLVDDATTISEDPAAGKGLVIAFLDDAITFTDDLVGDLEAAGAPDTETGEDTAEKLVTGIEDVRELFVGARDDTEALPADDPTALGSGLQDIGAALQDSATAVGAQFEEVLSSVDDPDLGDAFEDATACQDLASLS